MTESKKKKRTGSHNHSVVTMKSVLRIRPPLKKERDEHLVLEALPNGKSAALHPYANHLLSPHSTDTVQTGQDVELHFDSVLHAHASQDKVYFTVGQPVALAAMDSLKKASKDKKSSHLILSLGLPSSGKTYTSIGSPSNLTKRKVDTDGIIPRVIDSLFFQSVHSSTCKQKNVSFAVEVSVLQINQSKTNPTECNIYDLLQPLPKSANSGGALGNIASSIMSSSAVPAPVRKSLYAELSEPVKVQQDPTTSECFLTNATIKQCVTNEDARNALQMALSRSRQVSSKKKQSHLFVQVQPVLVSKRSGRIVLEGDMIGLLDMAGWEKHACTVSRSRDSLSSRTDAHSAVIHCLTALKHNATSTGKHKKVPFMQHKTTMILQQFFSASRVDTTNLMLLATASPCGSEYSDKKMLLSEILKIHRPVPATTASTGCEEDGSEKNATPPVKRDRARTASTDYATDLIKTGNNNSVDCKKDNHHGASLTYSESSFAIDDDDDDCSEEEIVLPPPIVPGFKITGSVFSPEVSAPIDTTEKRRISNAASPLPSPTKCTSPASGLQKDVDNSAVAQKKSYFERIGKAVQISTKTGRKVLERIAVTTAMELSEADYQRQFHELVLKNEEMEVKIKALEQENKKLKQENQRLKRQAGEDARHITAGKENGKKPLDETCTESCSLTKPFGQVRVISMDDTSDAVSDIAESPKTTASSFKSERSGTTKTSEHLPAESQSAFDNPLMQQMACMASDWILSNSKPIMPAAPSCPRPNKIDANNNPSEERKENDRQDYFEQSPYDNDNALYQHMALMNM